MFNSLINMQGICKSFNPAGVALLKERSLVHFLLKKKMFFIKIDG